MSNCDEVDEIIELTNVLQLAAGRIEIQLMKLRTENALLRAALQELWEMAYLLVDDKDVLCTWCRERNGRHTQECPFRLLAKEATDD